MITNSKISALIHLLDDPDEFIFNQVSKELITIGNDIVPVLESTWEESTNPILQNRIEVLLKDIHFEKTALDLKNWSQKDKKNILDAALILSRYQYPDFDEQYVYDFIEQLTQDVWLELNSEYTAMEKVHIINRVFFNIYGFEINKRNYLSEQNNLIYNVIRTRCGNSLSLSIIYLEIAQRLKIPIYGVNLPSLFIMAYLRAPIEHISEIKDKDILFYLNTFNNGSFFQQKDIHYFLKEMNADIKEEYIHPCNEITVIKSMIDNMMKSYEDNGDLHKIEKLKTLSHHIS